MEQKSGEIGEGLRQEDIDRCILVLQELIEDTDQLFELPEEKRIALLKAAGLLSRPDRDEFERRKKDARKAVKRKMIERDKHARRETGIRTAREAAIFSAVSSLPSSRVRLTTSVHTMALNQACM